MSQNKNKDEQSSDGSLGSIQQHSESSTTKHMQEVKKKLLNARLLDRLEEIYLKNVRICIQELNENAMMEALNSKMSSHNSTRDSFPAEEQNSPRKNQNQGEKEIEKQYIILNPSQEVKDKLFRVSLLILFKQNSSEISQVKEIIEKYEPETPIKIGYNLQEAIGILSMVDKNFFWTIVIQNDLDDFKNVYEKLYCKKEVKEMITYGQIKEKNKPNDQLVPEEKKIHIVCNNHEELDYYFKKERDIIQNRPPLPNFSGLSVKGNYREKAFNSLYNISGFIASMQCKEILDETERNAEIKQRRLKAKNQFFQLVASCSNNFSAKKFYKDFQQLKNQYPDEVEGYEKVVKWYTKESFFFKIINIGLRVLDISKDTYYLRLPCYDLYQSLKKMHKEQIESMKLSSMECYRGGIVSNQEIKYLQDNVGGYIIFQGFVSTSLKKTVGESYAHNCLFIIEVSEDQLQNPSQYDSGFAQISQPSQFPDEKEILFNVLNYYKILDVKEVKVRFKVLYEVRLEYGISKDSTKSQIVEYKKFHDHIRQKIKCQGDIMYFNYNWNYAEKYFQELEIKLKKKASPKTMINVYDRLTDIFLQHNNNQCQEYFHQLSSYAREENDSGLTSFTHFSILLLKKNPHSDLKLGGVKTEEKYVDSRDIMLPYLRSANSIFGENQIYYGEQSQTRNAIHNNIGALYTVFNSFSQAMNYLQNCQKLYQKSHNQYRIELSAVYNNIALCYNEVAREYQKSGKNQNLQTYWENAGEYYKKSLKKIGEEYKNNLNYLSVKFNYASFLLDYKEVESIDRRLEIGQAKTWLHQVQEALEKSSERINKMHLLYVYRKLCICYIVVGIQEKAIQYFKKTLQKLKEIELLSEEITQPKIQLEKKEITKNNAILRNNLGLIYFYQERMEESFEELWKSLQIYDRLIKDAHKKKKLLLLKAGTLNNLGSAYEKIFYFDKAKEVMDQAEKILSTNKIEEYDKTKPCLRNNQELLKIRKEGTKHLRLVMKEQMKNDFSGFKEVIEKRYSK